MTGKYCKGTSADLDHDYRYKSLDAAVYNCNKQGQRCGCIGFNGQWGDYENYQTTETYDLPDMSPIDYQTWVII